MRPRGRTNFDANCSSTSPSAPSTLPATLPPPFKKKKTSDVDRCGHLDITTHSKTMGIHLLPPLFWESFPQNVWSRLAGVRSHSAQRALVRLDGDVGLRSGCCAGLSCSSRPDWDKQFFASPLHGDAECHAERGNCCCKSWRQALAVCPSKRLYMLRYRIRKG